MKKPAHFWKKNWPNAGTQPIILIAYTQMIKITADPLLWESQKIIHIPFGACQVTSSSKIGFCKTHTQKCDHSTNPRYTQLLRECMTKFMINNRTDAWKTDVNLLNFMWIVIVDMTKVFVRGGEGRGFWSKQAKQWKLRWHDTSHIKTTNEPLVKRDVCSIFFITYHLDNSE